MGSNGTFPSGKPMIDADRCLRQRKCISRFALVTTVAMARLWRLTMGIGGYKVQKLKLGRLLRRSLRLYGAKERKATSVDWRLMNGTRPPLVGSNPPSDLLQELGLFGTISVGISAL